MICLHAQSHLPWRAPLSLLLLFAGVSGKDQVDRGGKRDAWGLPRQTADGRQRCSWRLPQQVSLRQQYRAGRVPEPPASSGGKWGRRRGSWGIPHSISSFHWQRLEWDSRRFVPSPSPSWHCCHRTHSRVPHPSCKMPDAERKEVRGAMLAKEPPQFSCEATHPLSPS